MKNLVLNLMSGIDIPVPEIQVNIHQPRIIEIAYMGEEDFFSAVQYLCISKENFESNPHINKMMTLELLFEVINNSDKSKKLKSSLSNLLMIMFPDYKVLFSVRSIILKPISVENGNMIIIDDNNFDILQSIFKEIFCLNSSLLKKDSYNPKSKMAKEIAEKLMKGREIAAKQKGELGTSVLTRYLSILTVGLNSMTLNDLLNLTLFQLYDLVERYMMYVEWDIDVKARLAGATSKNKDKQDDKDGWFKNIH